MGLVSYEGGAVAMEDTLEVGIDDMRHIKTFCVVLSIVDIPSSQATGTTSTRGLVGLFKFQTTS